MKDKKNTKKTKKKLSSRKISILIVVVISLIISGIIIHSYLNREEKENKAQTTKVTSSIEGYDYSLTSMDTKYYKELFEKLKKTLESDPRDEELYASLISQLFATDFYTLSNKVGSSDIGGLDFVLESARANFAMKAKDTMYKSVTSNLYGERDQELPEVTKVSIDSITKTSFTYNGTTDAEAYNVKISITYNKDLGYPTSAKLILVHNGKLVEVAKIN